MNFSDWITCCTGGQIMVQLFYTTLIGVDRVDGWMDDLLFYVLFNSNSVISG